jgi:prepilin-type N-terminal cleavage/methylation domain-containing protein
MALRVGRGFTLIEILIVVVILGILAGVVFPAVLQRLDHGPGEHPAGGPAVPADAGDRVQVPTPRGVARVPGGDPTVGPTEAAFLDQMLRFTDEACGVSPSPTGNYRYGPYLARMPANPLNGRTGVWVVTGDEMPPADLAQPYGWIYNRCGKGPVNLPGGQTREDADIELIAAGRCG